MAERPVRSAGSPPSGPRSPAPLSFSAPTRPRWTRPRSWSAPSARPRPCSPPPRPPSISTLLPSTQRAKFNAGALVRATLLDRYQAHKLGIEAGWLLRSEVRELEDRPTIPGIDDQPPGAVA